jgi:hypothetical protein
MAWIKATEAMPPAGKEVKMKWEDGVNQFYGDPVSELKDVRPKHYNTLLWWNESPDSKGNDGMQERIKELEKAIWQISLGPQGDDTEWIPYVTRKCKDILNKK